MTGLEWAALITALGTLVTAAAGWRKNAAELAQIRQQMVIDRQVMTQTRDQVTPNHGTSLADGVHRLEAGSMRHEAELREIRSDVRTLRTDLGRLADEDVAHRAELAEVRERMRACPMHPGFNVD